MAEPQEFEPFSDDTSSEGVSEHDPEESESEVEDDVTRKQQPKKTIITTKDAEEEELERLVLGSKSSFRDQLFRNDSDLHDLDFLQQTQQQQLSKSDEQEPGLESVDDADLFFLDTAAPDAATSGQKGAFSGKADHTAGADEDVPAWEDSDDERLTVSLAGVTQLRKLRITEGEDVVTGAEYARRLRRQYLVLNPVPSWAKEAAEGRPTKRRRRSSAGSSSDSSFSSAVDRASDEDDDDSDLSVAPLEEFLRDAGRLSGRDGQPPPKRRLRPEVIDIQRTRPIPDTHKAAVSNLSFHPEYPVLLSSSIASVLFLHHLDPTAHPTPNPKLTSVQAKQVDVRRAEFLYPVGDRIFFAGRRKYFHTWDLKSGTVEKTSQVQGSHRLEHKSMEKFKLSPCGRYMGIVASTRKGGGVVNVMSAGSRQWVAAARLDSRHGIADFAWWGDGDGMAILGRDGQVGEYSMVERKFVGVWRDEGCVGGIVIALGGRQGDGILGNDRWVAVGSNSGVTNVYERSELLAKPKKGAGGAAGQIDSGPSVKENPEPARRFEQLVTPITVVTFSPDGQLLAFGSQHKKDALRLAHLPSCTVYRNWPTEKTPLGRITCVAFGRGSDLLAVGNDAGKIRLWDIRS